MISGELGLKNRTRASVPFGYQCFHSTCVSKSEGTVGSAHSADLEMLSALSVLCNMLMDQKSLVYAWCT